MTERNRQIALHSILDFAGAVGVVCLVHAMRPVTWFTPICVLMGAGMFWFRRYQLVAIREEAREPFGFASAIKRTKP